jgi:hypothetical protein
LTIPAWANSLSEINATAEVGDMGGPFDEIDDEAIDAAFRKAFGVDVDPKPEEVEPISPEKMERNFKGFLGKVRDNLKDKTPEERERSYRRMLKNLQKSLELDNQPGQESSHAAKAKRKRPHKHRE